MAEKVLFDYNFIDKEETNVVILPIIGLVYWQILSIYFLHKRVNFDVHHIGMGNGNIEVKDTIGNLIKRLPEVST